jgi:hypothetical protein
MRAVVLFRLEQRFPTDSEWLLIDTTRLQLEDQMHIIVDLLIVGSEYWWSALCSDEQCCPPAGRPRVDARTQLGPLKRRQLWKSWKTYAAVDESSSPVPAAAIDEMVAWLSDVRLRDLLLAHAGQNPDSRDKWLTTIESLRQIRSYSQLIPLGAVECSLLYLRGDLKAARATAEKLLQRDGTYSLAVLLHKGLVSKAPPSTLEAAFCNASICDLLGSDEDDGPERAA